MTSARLLETLPVGTNALLIQAAIAPVDSARPAWQAWRSQRTIDEANWAEVRLLPCIAGRAKSLAITAAEQPRLDGIRRFVWSNTQKQLLAIRPAVQCLAEQGFEPMPLKGAAVICHGLSGISDRYIRDVDILLRPEYMARALELLVAKGWRSPEFPNELSLPTPGQFGTHAIKLTKAGEGELDLHEFAIAPNCFPALDRDLRSRGVRGAFLGVPCMLPAAEDLLVNVLEHSFRRDPDRVLDWSVDAAHLIQAGTIDWGLVERITLDRALAVPLECRLRYLREQCHLDAIPSTLLDALADAADDQCFIDEYLANQYTDSERPEGRLATLQRAMRSRASSIGSRANVQRVQATRPRAAPQGGNSWRVVELPITPARTKRVRFSLEYRPGFPAHLRCLVSLNCGALRLHRYSSRRGFVAQVRQKTNAGLSLEPAWFAAQETDRLALFLHFRRRDKRVPDISETRNISVECESTIERNGALSIRLLLDGSGQSGRSDCLPAV